MNASGMMQTESLSVLVLNYTINHIESLQEIKICKDLQQAYDKSTGGNRTADVLHVSSFISACSSLSKSRVWNKNSSSTSKACVVIRGEAEVSLPQFFPILAEVTNFSSAEDAVKKEVRKF